MNDAEHHQYGTEAADQYDETGGVPVRRWAEFPTFLAALGSVADARVLDLACGTGIVTRLVAGRGATRVVGVDSSEAMIAKARNDDSGGRIEYLVADVGTMPSLGKFDVATTAWLFSYAETSEGLGAMCTRIAEHLRPGGRLVATIFNPAWEYAEDPVYYATADVPPGRVDGTRYTFSLRGDQPLTFEVYYWSLDALTSMLTQAGFEDVATVPCPPSDEGIREMGTEFWQPWIANPTALVLTCHKRA